MKYTDKAACKWYATERERERERERGNYVGGCNFYLQRKIRERCLTDYRYYLIRDWINVNVDYERFKLAKIH